MELPKTGDGPKQVARAYVAKDSLLATLLFLLRLGSQMAMQIT